MDSRPELGSGLAFGYSLALFDLIHIRSPGDELCWRILLEDSSIFQMQSLARFLERDPRTLTHKPVVGWSSLFKVMNTRIPSLTPNVDPNVLFGFGAGGMED